jgi:hypothetical protein
VDVDLNDPPPDPVRLVLPDTGRVVVTAVDGRGQPLRSGSVRLAVERDENAVGPRQSMPAGVSPLKDGEAVFPFVGLDLPLTASVLGNELSEPVHVRARGPVRAGEDVTIEIRVDQTRPVIVGRTVDLGGHPIGDAVFQIEIRRGGTAHQAVRVASDAKGYMRVPLWTDSGTWTVVVKRMLDGNLQGEGRIEISAPFSPGERPVGDIAIGPGPLLVSGVVVDDRGDPVSGIPVSVRRRVFDAGGKASFHLLHVRHSDSAGRFELRGFVEPGDLRIGTQTPEGFIKSRPEGFELGATGVRLVLERTTRIEGRLLLDPGISSDHVRVVVTPLRKTDFPDEAILLDDGVFGPQRVPPGPIRVDVLLLHWTHPEERFERFKPVHPVATVEGVRAVRGQRTEHPRLTIDLRGLLHLIRVRVRPPHGMEDTPIALEATDAKGRNLWVDVNDDGSGSFVTDALPLTLSASGPGCRTEVRRGIAEDVDIALWPGSR